MVTEPCSGSSMLGGIDRCGGAAATAGLTVAIIVVPAGFCVANGVGGKLLSIDGNISTFRLKFFFTPARIGFHRLSRIVVHAVDGIASLNGNRRRVVMAAVTFLGNDRTAAAVCIAVGMIGPDDIAAFVGVVVTGRGVRKAELIFAALDGGSTCFVLIHTDGRCARHVSICTRRSDRAGSVYCCRTAVSDIKRVVTGLQVFVFQLKRERRVITYRHGAALLIHSGGTGIIHRGSQAHLTAGKASGAVRQFHGPQL